MKAPEKVRAETLADYLEVLTRAVFRAGLAWPVIERKWAGFREAFASFDPQAVAGFDASDVERLARDARIVRNRAKIEATIVNAARLLELDARPGGFAGWLRVHGNFEATVRALRAAFRFLGDTGAYYFLWVVDQPVPPYEQWCASRGIAAKPIEGA